MKSFALALSLFKEHQQVFLIFVAWSIVKILIGSVSKWSYAQFIKADIPTTDILVFLVLTGLLETSSASYLQKKTKLLTRQILRAFKREKMEDYKNNVSSESKEKMDVIAFDEKVDRLCDIVGNIMDWFIPNIISVIITLSLSFFTFSKSELWILVLIFAMHFASHYFFYSPLKEKLAIVNKELRKRREEARSMKALALEMFDKGSAPYSKVEEQDDCIFDTCDKYSEMINGANNIISYTNIATLVLVIMLVQNVNIKATIIAVMSFGQTIDNLMGHMTWLTRTDTMIDDFNDKCDKFIRIQKPKQKPWPKVVEVTDVAISRGKKSVKYRDSDNKLKIKQGDKILLRGSSGAGKTTFMKGLLGQLDGAFINGISAAHFMDNIVWVGQKTAGNFKELTVEQYFFGSNSYNSNRKKKNSKRKNSRERTIEYFCKMAMLDGWIAKMKASSSESWITAKIAVSGGEEQRLIIANKLYQAKKMNKPVIALDEPEHGTDLFDEKCNDGYEMLRRISTGFKGTTLIVISHGSNKRGKAHVKEVRHRAIKWNTVVSVDDFEVTIGN